MKVAITGASGFIGRHLCQSLRQQGHEVAAISRQRNSDVIDQKVAIDLTNANHAKILRASISGYDVVVHTIGLAHLEAENTIDSYEKFRAVNVGTARTIAEACVAENIRLLIFISSVKAVAEKSAIDLNGRARRVLDTDVPHPMDNYGRTKLEAENVIEELLRNTGTHFVILRPPLVYGVGQKGNLAKLFNLLSSRRRIVFPKINNARSMISVNNLCDAIVAVVSERTPKSGRYLIADTDLSSSQLASAIGEVLMTRVICFPLSTTLLRLLFCLVRKKEQIEKLTSSLIVDDTNFRQQFHWRPPFEFKDIMMDIANSFRTKQ